MGNSAAIGEGTAIKTRVRAFVVSNFLFGDGGDLEDDQSLLDAGVLDSTGVVELVGFLEEEFGIRIDDQEMIPENLDSIERITGYVQRKTGRA